MARTLPALPILKIEPALPMLRIEPTLPMLRIEPALPILKIEPALNRLKILNQLPVLRRLARLLMVRQSESMRSSSSYVEFCRFALILLPSWLMVNSVMCPSVAFSKEMLVLSALVKKSSSDVGKSGSAGCCAS